ncbi:hypothetical protein PanABDRAFT_1836 [Pantoea sp. aB]|jgi:hypothetical protein|nr:hypothetical protein PanABDRAFT_1836 [Pantoea sp. aB]
MEPVPHQYGGYPIFLWITGMEILFIVARKLG